MSKVVSAHTMKAERE